MSSPENPEFQSHHEPGIPISLNDTQNPSDPTTTIDLTDQATTDIRSQSSELEMSHITGETPPDVGATLDIIRDRIRSLEEEINSLENPGQIAPLAEQQAYAYKAAELYGNIRGLIDLLGVLEDTTNVTKQLNT